MELARRLGDRGDGVPPGTCVVLSGLVSFALAAAEELAVPAFVLWGTSACGFVGTLRLRELRHRGYTPLKDPFLFLFTVMNSTCVELHTCMCLKIVTRI